jgi:hypothetical protein
LAESQRNFELSGALGIGVSSGPPAVPARPGSPPEKMCTWPRVDVPATNSELGSPIRVMRHSSVSECPVETAMSGRVSVVPAATVGLRAKDLSGCGLSWHAFTLTFTAWRHLPTCRTSGTLAPTGTLGSVKCPFTSVVVLVIDPLL